VEKIMSEQKSLKICYIIPYINLDKYFQPWEKLLIHESLADLYAKEARDKGHNSFILILSDTPKVSVHRHKWGHIIFRIPGPEEIANFRPLPRLLPRLFNARYIIRKIVKENKVDVVHFIGYHTMMTHFAVFFLRDLKVVKILAFTGASLEQMLKTRLFRASLNILELIIRVSFNVADCIILTDTTNDIKVILSDFKVPERKIYIANLPAVNLDTFYRVCNAKEKLGWDNTKFHILYVGRVQPAQGLKGWARMARRIGLLERDWILMLRTLSETIKYVGSKKLQLHIVGSGLGMNDFESYIAKLGLEDLVSIHGYIFHDKLPLYYSASDLFFSPFGFVKFNEGLSVFESMACGTPVIGFKRYANLETNVRGGFLIDPNPITGSKELAEIINSGQFLKKSEECRRIARSFSAQSVFRKLEKLYCALVLEKANKS